ncbi:MAG: fructose 1,6-bisphosphatase, partial [Terriglobia bacterium]
GHFVAGCMRGSHQMPLMPVALNSTVSYFDGPPVVSAAGYCVQQGKLTEAVDAFAHPFWNTVRDRIAEKSMEMRRQGFSGAAMLPMNELEYTGVMEKLKELDTRFKVRAPEKEKVSARD